MEEWIERYAGALGEPPVSPRELGAILKLARDVAHGVERKLAPVSTFLAGVHVGRSVASGGSREEALERAVREAAALLPPADTGEGGG